MNAPRRIAARSRARSLGMELQSFALANLGKSAMGLPVMHIRGGVKVEGEAEQHRT